MRKRSLLALAVLATALVFAGNASDSNAAPTGADTVETTIRVSRDCKVTVTTRWSSLSFTPTEARIDVNVDGIDRQAEFASTTARRGRLRSAVQASQPARSPHGPAGGTPVTQCR